ncbi:MAG: hypothetical protein ACLTF1_12760 [Clostridium sp.]
MLYYKYCVEMGLSERNFFESPLKKVIKLLEIHRNQNFPQEEEEVAEIQSMRQIEGWENG